MSRVSINETTLTAIGDAIRGKTGKSELIAPGDMPAEIAAIVSGGADPVIEELQITTNGTYNAYDGVDGFAPVVVNVPQDGGPPASALTYRGRCNYMFANGVWDWFISQYGNQLDITVLDTCEYMFRSCTANYVPFDIKIEGKNVNATQMFNSYSGENIPNIYAEYPPTNMSYMFTLAKYVKYFPEGFAEDWDWTHIENATGSYDAQNANMFAQSASLRVIPEALIRTGNPKLTYSNCIYTRGFQRCYCLEKVSNLHVYEGAFTSNAFSNTVEDCYRLKDFTFRTQEDGTPFVRGWKNQVIDLSDAVGYGYSPISYGFKESDFIDNLVKYEGYVNDGDNPNGCARYIEWATYNRKSAVRTINTLPDCSASGGINTIKFSSAAASAAGDEYAMAKLSEAEIAVAAAKGWTVTLV